MVTPVRQTERRFLFPAILLVLLVLFVEIIAYFGCLFLQTKGVVYNPYINPEYSSYVTSLDPVLGWPSPDGFGHDGYQDATGSRISPAYKDPSIHDAWIAMYGDSFTWGSEVDNEHTWSNNLSKLIQSRVANYGVGGYGTDQAFLRYHNNPHHEEKIVFLNHLSENIVRNVNQYRQILYPGSGLGFKPRFIVGMDNNLELIPLPRFSNSEYLKVVEEPGSFLDHEYFTPGKGTGISELSFPFSWTLIKSFNNFHIRSQLTGRPWYADFYLKNHPSKALELTTAILKSFHKEALARGQFPVVSVIPTGLDLVYYKEKGVWPYQKLIDNLKQSDIETLNFGNSIMMKLGSMEIISLFNTISGHYNEAGNAILAEIALEYLKNKKIPLPEH